MAVTSLADYQRNTNKAIKDMETELGVLDDRSVEVLKPKTWVATVKDVVFDDSGLTIPEWQDIGCSIQFQGNGRVTVLTVGCVMQRLAGVSDLHYEVQDTAGKTVVGRDLLRIANTRFLLEGGSQVVAGRMFAHTFRPGTYTARLLVRTTHTNTEETEATLTVHNASISVRNY